MDTMCENNDHLFGPWPGGSTKEFKSYIKLASHFLNKKKFEKKNLFLTYFGSKLFAQLFTFHILSIAKLSIYPSYAPAMISYIYQGFLSHSKPKALWSTPRLAFNFGYLESLILMK